MRSLAKLPQKSGIYPAQSPITLKRIGYIPGRCGVYRFLDPQGRLLYIGKAKNLKNRIKSYFTKTAELSPAKRQMAEKIKKIQFTVLANESEALLLERHLIKKYQPPYNVDLKDDKSWLYAKITAEEYPKIILTRSPNKARYTKHDTRKIKYFGPYTSAASIRQTLKLLKKLFPYYSPSGPMINLGKNARSPYHLGRYLNEPLLNRQDWLKHLRQIISFLSGQNKKFKKAMVKKMRGEAERKNFERAAVIRDQLKALEQISLKQQVIKNNEVDENYLNKRRKNFQQISQLQKIFKLKKLPTRLEAYDISNIQGQMAVGSMVVFSPDQPDKSQYRRFKIKTVKGANDPAMIGEVIKRRFQHAEWPWPDLILIDGGQAQLNAALKLLDKLKNLPASPKRQRGEPTIVALAKKEEQIYLPGQKIPLKLPPFSPAILLLRFLRDEAHRFAINYYRKLHSKKIKGGVDKL